MHQPDPSADLAARKMAHPADIHRRGSGASSNPSTLNLTGAGVGGGHALSAEDYQPSHLVQPQTASSLPSGPQQHPPQTLNLMPQPPVQSGAQIKKKSGFQITSVTPAQISANMSSNNSIAEDTESYDDLDESHTEDLSSSEILDVSLSRATDLGGPERSSSEETLNNFQEAETPGAVSPNQPHLPQHHLPPHVQQSIMINGNVHHAQHHHHHHPHGHHQPPHPGLVAASIPGGTTQTTAPVKMATAGSSDSSNTTSVPASSAPSAAVPAAGPVPPMVRKASGPVSMGINAALGVGATSSGNISNMSGLTTTLPSGVNVNQPSVASSSNVTAVSANLNTNLPSMSGNGSSATSSSINNVCGAAGITAVGPATGQQAAASHSTATSRFRVVKLDSSTEPFKKGRWTCMEFYDKENAVPPETVAAINKAVESIKQTPLEVTSERESTSGSSVSSNISTLSHYTESVGSGEIGAQTMQQQGFQGLGPQQIEFSNTIIQNVPVTNIPQSISQPQLAQLQIHSQDASYSSQKQVGQPGTVNLNAGVQPATVNVIGVQSSLGHQQPAASTMIPQQLPYTQQPQPIQSLPAVQQLQYAHQQSAPTQMTSGHVMPVNQSSVPGNLPEYIQHPQILQGAVAPVQPGSAGVANTAVVQAQVMQAQLHSSTAQAPTVAPTQSVAHAQSALPATSGQVIGVGQQANISTAVHQAPASQAASVMQQSVPVSSQPVLPPSQGISMGAPGLPQQAIIAPQNPLLPAKPQAQHIEPAVQGMASQQVPVASTLLTATSVPSVQQLSTSIPPATLGPPPTVAQPSAVQNGNLSQNVSQAPVIASLPVAQNMPPPMAQSSGHFLAPSLIQSVASQIEDARRLMAHSVAGLPHVGEGVGLDSSAAGSLLPLKSLPLSTSLIDGEDESASGASVVAIDNKIEQAMDLVKSHLMYAVREEVEVLKEQIKELIEKNSQLEQENNLLKTLASPEQLAQFQAQLQSGSPPSSSNSSCSQPAGNTPAPTQPSSQSSGPSA
ncbi:TSC22 domain family protein 1 isoform X1 [Spea bombifrons]|uniref:TSC22 domain family protein 1 isoform X1 n=1 Tax=Spea bombifrons TaxID=233779 RepID=UPI002349F91A|nr:TSC22 domain family protein 1 isoform X1 [Spea bombifrons]